MLPQQEIRTIGRIKKGIKKVSNHTEPLQPPTLAAFPPWGSSEGAGRMTLTGRKGTKNVRITIQNCTNDCVTKPGSPDSTGIMCLKTEQA